MTTLGQETVDMKILALNPQKTALPSALACGTALVFATTSAWQPCSAGKYYGAASLQVNKKPDPKASKSAAWNAAVKAFASKKYKEAAEKFEYVDSHGGCSENTHYYLAQCYQMLNQTSLAQQHYQWVGAYGKNAKLQSYARQAASQIAYYQQHRTYSGQGGVPHRQMAMTSLPTYPAGYSPSAPPRMSFG